MPHGFDRLSQRRRCSHSQASPERDTFEERARSPLEKRGQQIKKEVHRLSCQRECHIDPLKKMQVFFDPRTSKKNGIKRKRPALFCSLGPTCCRETVKAVMMAWVVRWIHPPTAPCRKTSSQCFCGWRKGTEIMYLTLMDTWWWAATRLTRFVVETNGGGHWFIHGGVVVCVLLLSHGAPEACCNHAEPFIESEDTWQPSRHCLVCCHSQHMFSKKSPPGAWCCCRGPFVCTHA